MATIAAGDTAASEMASTPSLVLAAIDAARDHLSREVGTA